MATILPRSNRCSPTSSLWIRQVSKPRARPQPGRDVVTAGDVNGGARQHRPQARREGLAGSGLPGQANPVTGKPSPGSGYARRAVNHGEPVLRTFYDFHWEAGSGPMANPFPLDGARRGGRSHEDRSPAQMLCTSSDTRQAA